MQPQLHQVGTPSATSLIGMLKRDAPVVFAGSAISIWEPSSMPTGQEFTACLFDLLFDSSLHRSPEEQQIIEKLFNEMPFEHVMEVCPDSKNAADLVLELYGKDLPNPIHEALGAALRDGSVHSLITTNYDCCIEAVLANMAGLPIQRIVTERDISPLAVNGSLYFKVHGSSES